MKFKMFIVFLSIFNTIFCDYIEFFNKSLMKVYHRETPKSYIDRAIALFKKRNGKVIVELGSMRFPLTHNLDTERCAYCMDGHSTLLWARTNAELYTVDIGPKTIEIATEACQNYPHVTAVLQDGIEFLNNFNKPIDLLFLDAWDAVPDTNYAEKHLEAYQAAKKNLHDNSLILIDDTDVYEGGKGRLIIPQAIIDGYKVIFSGRQTLLSK